MVESAMNPDIVERLVILLEDGLAPSCPSILDVD